MVSAIWSHGLIFGRRVSSTLLSCGYDYDYLRNLGWVFRLGSPIPVGTC